ncbi:hypothetical protein, partial [Sulfitobacter sp. R18_1]|uniref:hypothetical protein n=1 Tax=Sulfitobacter sp. R18_1 TaxID=2821104 RepID=UPI001AD9CAE2
PAAITIGSGKNFDLRAVDKVGHKVGLIIGSNPRSDGRRRRFTAFQAVFQDNCALPLGLLPPFDPYNVKDLQPLSEKNVLQTQRADIFYRDQRSLGHNP